MGNTGPHYRVFRKREKIEQRKKTKTQNAHKNKYIKEPHGLENRDALKLVVKNVHVHICTCMSKSRMN